MQEEISPKNPNHNIPKKVICLHAGMKKKSNSYYRCQKHYRSNYIKIMGYLIKKNIACKTPRYLRLDAAGRICSELSRGHERRLKRAEFTDQFTPNQFSPVN
jgi:hypothetical protein